MSLLNDAQTLNYCTEGNNMKSREQVLNELKKLHCINQALYNEDPNLFSKIQSVEVDWQQNDYNVIDHWISTLESMLLCDMDIYDPFEDDKYDKFTHKLATFLINTRDEVVTWCVTTDVKVLSLSNILHNKVYKHDLDRKLITEHYHVLRDDVTWYERDFLSRNCDGSHTSSCITMLDNRDFEHFTKCPRCGQEPTN